MTAIKLPEGFTIRPATMGDIPACIEMFNLWAEDALGYKDMTEEGILNQFESPAFDPEINTLLVFTESGTLVGYADAWTHGEMPVFAPVFGHASIPIIRIVGLALFSPNGLRTMLHTFLISCPLIYAFALRLA